MTTDYLKQGETLNLSITAKDSNGSGVALSGYSAAMRICKDKVGGTTAADISLGISNDTITGSYNTNSLNPNDYYYDIRLTDESGNDFWSAPVKMVILPRNTPSS